MERLFEVFIKGMVAVFLIGMLMVSVGCGKKSKYKTPMEPALIIEIIDGDLEGCENPAEAILSGLDTNFDGLLQDEEVTSVVYQCLDETDSDDDKPKKKKHKDHCKHDKHFKD